jgi:hypothetical protein
VAVRVRTAPSSGGVVLHGGFPPGGGVVLPGGFPPPGVGGVVLPGGFPLGGVILSGRNMTPYSRDSFG